MGKETGAHKEISRHLILQLQESKFVSITLHLVFFRIKALKSLSPASFKIKYYHRISDIFRIMTAELLEQLAESFSPKGKIAVFMNFPKLVDKKKLLFSEIFFFPAIFSCHFLLSPISYFLVTLYLGIGKDQLPASEFLNT